jgi:hypothetical protein
MPSLSRLYFLYPARVFLFVSGDCVFNSTVYFVVANYVFNSAVCGRNLFVAAAYIAQVFEVVLAEINVP